MKIGTVVLTVEMPYQTFVNKFGPHHLGHPSDWDAPGPVELWFFELPWGLKVGLEYHLSISMFDIAVDRFEMEAVSDYLDLRQFKHYWHTDFIAQHRESFAAFSEGLLPASLYRLDDNGNTTRMRSFESRRVADYYQRLYESRGHKQSYWVELD